MTETEAQEWQERLAAMAEEAKRKAEDKKAYRAQRKRHRNWGLRQRHAAKLANRTENTNS